MHIIHTVFYFLNNLKIYHWSTKSYARHKASDDCFNGIQTLFDRFVEVYIGKYGRDKLFSHKSSDKQQIFLQVINDKNIVSMFKKLVSFFNDLDLDQVRDSDLITIRDEITATLNQTLYLFTLE